jgi:hypothetical protein
LLDALLVDIFFIEYLTTLFLLEFDTNFFSAHLHWLNAHLVELYIVPNKYVLSELDKEFFPCTSYTSTDECSTISLLSFP